MKKIVLASNNNHKIKEFKEILTNYEILSLKDIGFEEEIEENGTTFEENAKIKVDAISAFLKKKKEEMIVIADDSGLCCNALDGKPGIHSARYAGDHNNQANRDKLRKDLEGKDKTAYFICCIALKKKDGEVEFFKGTTSGKIIEEEKGDKSFGYDCIFLSDDLGKTFGEATEEEKNSVSHRKRAIEQLKKAL